MRKGVTTVVATAESTWTGFGVIGSLFEVYGVFRFGDDTGSGLVQTRGAVLTSLESERWNVQEDGCDNEVSRG